MPCERHMEFRGDAPTVMLCRWEPETARAVMGWARGVTEMTVQDIAAANSTGGCECMARIARREKTLAGDRCTDCVCDTRAKPCVASASRCSNH